MLTFGTYPWQFRGPLEPVYADKYEGTRLLVCVLVCGSGQLPHCHYDSNTVPPGHQTRLYADRVPHIKLLFLLMRCHVRLAFGISL